MKMTDRFWIVWTDSDHFVIDKLISDPKELELYNIQDKSLIEEFERKTKPQEIMEKST